MGENHSWCPGVIADFMVSPGSKGRIRTEQTGRTEKLERGLDTNPDSCAVRDISYFYYIGAALLAAHSSIIF